MEIAALTLAVFVAGWAIFIWFRPSPRDTENCCVFVADGDGVPLSVVILGPGGQEAATDLRGLGRVPTEWLGSVVSIRDPEAWRELSEVRLPRRATATIKVVIRA